MVHSRRLQPGGTLRVTLDPHPPAAAARRAIPGRVMPAAPQLEAALVILSRIGYVRGGMCAGGVRGGRAQGVAGRCGVAPELAHSGGGGGHTF
jgi:hypothetical protein